MDNKAHSVLVSATHPSKLDDTALICQLWYVGLLTVPQIMQRTGFKKSKVYDAMAKYKPKQTGRDLVLTISSKLNFQDNEK